MAHRANHCKPSKALLIQALLSLLISLTALVAWIVSWLYGLYFVTPEIFQAFFVLDVFILLPLYVFGSGSLLLDHLETEAITMVAALAIFCTRAAFLLGALTEPLILGTLNWFFIFFLLPLQAWIFALYLGRRLEILEWGKKLSDVCRE